jgi:CRISPR-associated protein Csd1
MLLKRLVEYAARDGSIPSFHRERAFDWQLNLALDGKPESVSLQSLRQPDPKGKLRGTTHVVPATVRTMGIAPNLAADDAQYVLGWADDDTIPDRVRKCHLAFVDLTRRWAESDAGRADPVAQAVWAFYRDDHARMIRRDPECTAKSGVLIAVGGISAYKAQSIAAVWTEEVTQRKGSVGAPGLCLVCGAIGPLLDTLPGKVPSRLVPGATNDAALVSVNARVFGYDLTTQLVGSPVCINCGEAVTAGLVRALDSGHSTTYGDQDSRMAWWTTEKADSDLMPTLHQASPRQVATVLASVHRGRAGAGAKLEKEKFCALTIGGNIARVMVRDWLEMPLSEVEKNVADWFTDHEIDPIRRDGPRHHGLGRFALVSGRWVRAQGRDGRGRYADFGAKGADRLDDVYRDLVRAALRHTTLPPSLLAHLVHRVRTDGHLDDTRAALIRLILTRHPSIQEKPLSRLDPTNTTPAYVSGRAFAVLEQIQYEVSRVDNKKINTTYGDRFFAGAISNPRAALVSGRKVAAAWLRKLRKLEKNRNARTRHEKVLDELFGLLGADVGIPSHMSLQEQSLFLLGYHHQRVDHFAAARAHTTRTDNTAAEETA